MPIDDIGGIFMSKKNNGQKIKMESIGEPFDYSKMMEHPKIKEFIEKYPDYAGESELRAVYRRIVSPGKTDLFIRSFPNSLKEQLKIEADRRHLSTASFIKMALQEYVDNLKKA